MRSIRCLLIPIVPLSVCLLLSVARGQALENADLGPFLVNTIQGPDNNTAYKGVVVKLGKEGDAAVCFDTELLRYMGGWVKESEQAEAAEAKAAAAKAAAEPKPQKETKPGAKPAKPPEKSTWPSGPWAGLIDPNHSTTFTAHHGGPPKVRGEMRFVTKIEPGWGGGEKGDDFTDSRKTSSVDKKFPQRLGNLPHEWAHYKGLYRNGEQVVLSYTVGDCDVLETPGLAGSGEYPAFTRTIRLGKSDKPMTMAVCDVKDGKSSSGAAAQPAGGASTLTLEGAAQGKQTATPVTTVTVDHGPAGFGLAAENGRVLLHLPPRNAPVVFELVVWNGPRADAKPIARPAMVDPTTLIKGGPSLWGQPLEAAGKLQTSGTADDAYVVDTITAPENNPYHTFMRFCGFDFFSDGHTAAVSTIGGDVWIVSGIDDKLEHLKWKRFATGLFMPLGLKIRDDVVYTVGRDQVTGLHDLNGDGEADFYENFNNDCQVTANYHEFTLDMQTDSQGNFFYSKCAPYPPDVKSDDQGTMVEISKDGKQFQIFCTGLRAPNGSAMDEHDQLYTGENEGHWQPSSKFEHLKRGKFYGMVPAAHTPEKPTSFEPPVFWLPHNGVDNSSGAVAVAPAKGKWGPLDGHMVVASYGMSSLFAASTEEVGTGEQAMEQGAAVKFPLKFESSVMRARFNGGRAYPNGDGQLYLCGLKGWQTNAGRDGAFQRVRYQGGAGKPCRLPVEFHAAANGLLVTFAEPLDKASATDAGNWSVEQWNYHWTQNYGSPEFSVKNPSRAAHDDVDVKSAKLSADGKTVLLEIDGLAPVMQMKTRYDIKDASGKDVKGEIFSTINKVGPARQP